MKKVFIVHGYNASVHDHWFPWLKRQVEAVGHFCEIIQLENSDHPQYEVWKHNLSQQIKILNEDVIFVAHSLGCITSLGFLSDKLSGARLHAIFIVAGFNQKLNALPELNSFISQVYVDDAMLRLSIDHRFLYFSNNDPYVPAPLSIQLGRLINAQMLEVRNAGHFMTTDGFTEFPQLWDKLKILL